MTPNELGHNQNEQTSPFATTPRKTIQQRSGKITQQANHRSPRRYHDLTRPSLQQTYWLDEAVAGRVTEGEGEHCRVVAVMASDLYSPCLVVAVAIRC